ncbi:MAG TPA: VWA domain-containing protein [Steroidobacteraceae bacterium]
MTFAQPLWLLAGSVACLGLIWMWRRYDVRQRAALATFVAAHLRAQLTTSLSIVRRRVKRGLFLAALALLFVALAGPQAGYQWEQVTRRGNDIMFAVDTSRSMLTPDVKPNRLARAKLAIDDFIDRLDGDAIGLVAFAGTAFLQVPLTTDYEAFRDSVNTLDTNVIPRGGTNIASAIQEAQSALDQRAGSDKILILVTDGEDLAGNALVAAKAAARQDGLRIYTVGVGTANGDLIALPADQGGAFVKDLTGNVVKSRLDESGLRAIAAATGGSYAPLGGEGEGLEAIYRQALAPLVKHDLASSQRRVSTQRYQWPLAAALGMLLASVLIGTRRNIRGKYLAASVASTGRAALAGAAALSTLMLLLCVHPAHASTSSANVAYAKGDYVKAERDYAAAVKRDPNTPALQFNLGTAAYKAGRFDEAAQAFQASVGALQSANQKRLAEQAYAYYDLGNTLYRTGQKTEQSNTQQTIEGWTRAVKAYDVALQLRPNDADGKFNRGLVQRKLETLKKKQSEQDQQKKSGGGAQQQKQSGNSQTKEQKQAGQQPGQQAQDKSQQKGTQAKDQKQARQQSGQQAQDKSQQKDSQTQGEKQSQQQSDQLAQNSSQQQPSATSHGTSQPQNRSESSGQPAQQPSRSAGQPQRAHQASGTDQREDKVAQFADSQHLPGEMSREEARELLDSVKGEERRLPTIPLARNGANDTSSDEAVKDW